jgi:hypothetical protein
MEICFNELPMFISLGISLVVGEDTNNGRWLGITLENCRLKTAD